MGDLLRDGLRFAAVALFIGGVAIGAAGYLGTHFEADPRAGRIGKGPVIALVGFAMAILGMGLAVLWDHLCAG